MGSFSFKSEEDVQSSGNAPFLTMPYLGKARLVDVYSETIEGKDGTEYPNVLQFRFKTFGKDIQGNDVKGHVIEKTEFPPREDDDPDKVDNKRKRVGYIMKYFIPMEEIVGQEKGIDADNWEQFVQEVIKRFEAHDDYDEVPIKIKVPANIYQGEANLQIPNYKGFIQGKDSEEAISFTSNEMKDNKEYVQLQTEPDEGAPDGATDGMNEDDVF